MSSNGPVFEVGEPGVEQLAYNNPFQRPVSPMWYQNEVFWFLNTDYQVVYNGNPDIKVKEYVFFYGTPENPGQRVQGQFPVYNLVPGRVHYASTPQQVNVYVPDNFEANSLRSSDAVLLTNYTIVPTGNYYNRPVL